VNIPYFIAVRYLFSKKKHNVINIISLVSVVGVAVVTMALIIVLSVMNGMNGMIDDSMQPFNSDIKILPVKGKTFTSDSLLFKDIKATKGLLYFSEVIEENTLVKYEKRQRPVIIKGVSLNYYKERENHISLLDGEFFLKKNGFDYVVPGRGVARDLGIGLNFVAPLEFYFPKRGKINLLNPARALNHEYAFSSSIFLSFDSFNTKYIFTSLAFARELFDLENKVSYLELDMDNSYDLFDIKDDLQEKLGKDFRVLTRYEQNESIYKMMKTEKLSVFFILAFILLIASFNIVGSLTMLILDKKDDINTLSYMGMKRKDIEKVFWNQGWLISVVGCSIGLLIGLTICFAQKYFELISIGINDMPYPVNVDFMDIIIVIGTVLLIGYIAARYPVQYLIKRLSKVD